jgi:HlyD family secretion protein
VSVAGALRTCGSGLRRFGRTPGPGLLAAALALAACTSSSAPPQPQTARVERTTVYTAVSSSGALSASSEQNLGFLRGGRLTAVNVQVGDRVTAGQVLATLDDGPARRTLEQQQAQLDAQRAVLARLVNSTAVPGAQNSVQQAQAILDATEDQVQATREADDSALNRAQKQLDFDEDAQDNAQDQLDADEQACGASTGTGDATTGTFTLPFSAASTNPTTSPTSPTTGSGTGTSTGTGMSDGVAAADDPDAAEYKADHRAWHHRIGATSTGTGSSTGGSSTGTGAGGTGTGSTAAPGTFSALTAPVDPVGSGACSRIPSDQSALAAADRQVVASRTARDAARQKRDVDAAAGQVSIENARQGVVTAQNSLDSAATDRPSTLAQQQAVVDGQDAVVRQAQQDVEETILRAPVDGTVSALNGAVGEYVAASSGTSALAPGSVAAIPGTSGAATEAAAPAVARPGGTQFLVLDGIDTFQVVVPFEESDAARITADQTVDVTFDAIPDLTRRGTVLAVAPAATASSGVIGYYVTVLLTETDPRLRDGQTAQAAVHTDELRDVPAVPNSAVHREGGQTTVTVVGPGGVQRRVPFQAGVVGDQLTQVVSGLMVGDEVVVGDRS